MGRVFLLSLWASCQVGPSLELADERELEVRMAELVNEERAARDLSRLAFTPVLADVAREYSARMAEAGRVHHDLDRPMEARIEAVLPGTCTFGENLSKHTSIEYSLADLMASPGHRANLLSSRFTLMGIGIVRVEDFLYITQEFARPCDPPVRRSKRSQDLSQ